MSLGCAIVDVSDVAGMHRRGDCVCSWGIREGAASRG